MKKLEGKVALITGAAVGLGEGIATAYAKYGAKLCMVDLSPQVEKTAQRLREEYGAQIVTVVANVAKKDDMLAAAAKAAQTFGEINVACCNAGVCRLAPFEEMSDEIRDFHIDVNIKGVWNTCKAVIPYMLKQGGGSIVIASSVTGDIVADAGEAAYAMTKAALVGLTKCLAVEYADRNIRVNCGANSALSSAFWEMRFRRTPEAEERFLETLQRVHAAKRSLFTTHLLQQVDTFLPSRVDAALKKTKFPELQAARSLDLSMFHVSCEYHRKALAVLKRMALVDDVELDIFTADNTNVIESYFSVVKRRLCGTT